MLKRHHQRPSPLQLSALALEERIERALADARRSDARLFGERLRIEGTLLALSRQQAEVDLLGARVVALREMQTA